MAYSYWIFVNSENLLTPEEFAKAVYASSFPLEIDSDWDWKELEGWLPMSWNGVESGFEIDYEPSEQKDLTATSEAGFSDVNAVLVITVRGWNSLRAASVFAGIVTYTSGGCVSESEGEFIGPGEVSEWTSAALQAADLGEAKEVDRRKTEGSNPRERQGVEALAEILPRVAGKVTKLLLTNDHLSLLLNSGSFLSGNAWRLFASDKVLDVSRWRTVKQQEVDVLTGNGPDTKQMELADAMQDDLDEAKERDQQDLEAAYVILESVDDLSVESVRVVSPALVEVALTGDTNLRLEFVTDMLLAQFTASAGSETVQLSAPLPALEA